MDKIKYEPLLVPRGGYIDPERKEKICARCKQIKPISEFGRCRGRRDRHHWRCRPCAVAHNQEYNAKHKEQMRWAARVWREKNPSYGLCHSVGLPLGEGLRLWRHLYKKQNGKCAICLRENGSSKVKLGFDHDHKTGIIRGLLCNPCNFLIGRGQDNPNLFFAAIAYLKKANEITNNLPISQRT